MHFDPMFRYLPLLQVSEDALPGDIKAQNIFMMAAGEAKIGLGAGFGMGFPCPGPLFQSCVCVVPTVTVGLYRVRGFSVFYAAEDGLERSGPLLFLTSMFPT